MGSSPPLSRQYGRDEAPHQCPLKITLYFIQCMLTCTIYTDDVITSTFLEQAKHWTEFKLVSVFAVHQLLLHDFAVGLDIATRYYDTIATLTLIPSYYVASEGLAVKGTPGWQQGNFPNSDCAVRDCNAIFNLMGGGGVLKEERRRKKTKQNKDV